jgi:hypothetical protein
MLIPYFIERIENDDTQMINIINNKIDTEIEHIDDSILEECLMSYGSQSVCQTILQFHTVYNYLKNNICSVYHRYKHNFICSLEQDNSILSVMYFTLATDTDYINYIR